MNVDLAGAGDRREDDLRRLASTLRDAMALGFFSERKSCCNNFPLSIRLSFSGSADLHDGAQLKTLMGLIGLAR